jgi:hypothetical protein
VPVSPYAKGQSAKTAPIDVHNEQDRQVSTGGACFDELSIPNERDPGPVGSVVRLPVLISGGFAVTGRICPVTGSRMKIPGGNPFWRADTAMCVPSGDQSGANSAPLPVVVPR